MLSMCCDCLLLQSCPTPCSPIDYSPPGSSVHGILQAGILEWTAMPSSRGSSRPRDRIQVSRLAGCFFTHRATRGSHCFLPEAKLAHRSAHYCLAFGHSTNCPLPRMHSPILWSQTKKDSNSASVIIETVPLDKLGNLTKPYLSKRSVQPYLTGLLQR